MLVLTRRQNSIVHIGSEVLRVVAIDNDGGFRGHYAGRFYNFKQDCPVHIGIVTIKAVGKSYHCDNAVVVGIDAPKSVSIMREELLR